MAVDQAEALLVQAKEAGSRQEAVRLAGEALVEELRHAMKSSGIAKADQSLAALEKAGLHTLLAVCLHEGRVRFSLVNEELDRFRKALVSRDLSANDIKLGILAFDETAQRLSLVAGKNGEFVYPHVANRARDSLITFARSLHR